MSVKSILKFAEDEKAGYVNVRFTDLVGAWHHLTFPIEELSEKSFEEGFGFDGSSLRGWASIHESDMLLVPDPYRYWLDPFMAEKTLCLVADVVDPITKEGYWLDPRGVARRAESYLKFTGVADTAYFGPEAEFFVFDDVRFSNEPNAAGFSLDNPEAIWNTNGQNGNSNLGYHIRNKEGYVPLPPLDTLQDFRTEVASELKKVGITVECHHHEVATAGQCEIDFRYSTLLGTADNLQLFKYTVRNVARRHGKGATFMPKPLYGDNGSGMHCHQSLWKGEKPLFAGDGYAGLSDLARHYIGGLLKHAASIVAFAAPTTNSYKRLVPGFEAPVNLAYSARNRSAAVRIPMYSPSPKTKRIEFRSPDPSCNPYLSFAAMLMAGLDGIENKIHPGDPLDKDIYSLSPEELKEVPHVPKSLDAALDALRRDHAFLLKGDVFTPDILDTWIQYKTDKEVDEVRLKPTPTEFALYFDC
jgi:glutamine synthetase